VTTPQEINMPTQTFNARPASADVLVQLETPAGGACMEHRDGHTFIWPEDWWDAPRLRAVPLTVLVGELSPEMATAWLLGWHAGRQVGHAEGQREGFANCQGGLRALLGASSASDVERLLIAARNAQE
jgi:hypothetical protein